jgi:hypothetical protein
MIVVFAAVLVADAIHVFDIRCASNVDLALVDEVLNFLFVGYSPGLYWGGVIGHVWGRRIMALFAGGCCLLLLWLCMPASPMLFSH